MANTDFLGGFEAIAGSLSNRSVTSMSQDGASDPEDENYEYRDPSDLKGDTTDIEDGEKAKNSQKGKQEQDESEKPSTEEEETEETEEEEEVDDEDTTKQDKEDSEDSEGSLEDLGEAEPEISQYVQDKLGELLGWDFDDDEKFNSIEDVVNFMKEVVDVNSKPQFANEELEQLNKFVADGGNISDYIKTSRGEVDLENIDLSKESNQKSVIEELLKEQGYSDSRIKRSLERYEDAGVLEDEAEDAKELLAEIREKKSQKLLEQTEKERKQAEEQQQKYIEGVQNDVNSLESVRGIPISKEEKKQLMDYIFKPTADGRTRYQKDYLSDTKNLIESAYFTMKGDTFVQKVQRKANSDAAKNLKKKLSSKGTKKSKNQDDSDFLWSSISSQLRKPN